MSVMSDMSGTVVSSARPDLAAKRAEFDRDGFTIIRGALTPDEVGCYREALDRVYLAAEADGRIKQPGGALHQLSAIANCPAAVGLLDHPATFPLVWSILGWNIHVYHSHLDVHPPVRARRPFRFEWHQDGGRQNREIETDPRPRLSVKLAYWLSDVSQPGRGNFKVVPGSHRTNRISGPPRRDIEWPDPEGAIEVTAAAGDVVLFDRRLWHARSENYSLYTRKAMFFGYTYRWIAMRDENDGLRSDGLAAGFTSVQRQLLGGLCDGLGAGAGDHAWGHEPNDTPLYRWLKERDLFDHANPPLKPLRRLSSRYRAQAAWPSLPGRVRPGGRGADEQHGRVVVGRRADVPEQVVAD